MKNTATSKSASACATNTETVVDWTSPFYGGVRYRLSIKGNTFLIDYEEYNIAGDLIEEDSVAISQTEFATLAAEWENPYDKNPAIFARAIERVKVEHMDYYGAE